jgi:asparagine synthase (glutamine-hydrolysing)
MRDMTIRTGEEQHDPLFVHEAVCCTRCHIGVIQVTEQPFSAEGVHIWLDGEFYNRDHLCGAGDAAGISDAELLGRLYREHRDWSFLREIDGIFSAVIYDSTRMRIHLIDDRYGMRHLYWTRYRGGLAWSSEVKAVLALPGYVPRIDRFSIDQYFALGHLLEDRTWLEGVKLMASGSVLTFDLREEALSEERYWWWDRIVPREGPLDEDALLEEFVELLLQAVERRSRPGERVGIALSGGMDSRTLLAAMPQREYPIHAVTFGLPGCVDSRIAARLAKIKGAHHHLVPVTGENWLAGRLEGIWWTDGQANLITLHGIESLKYMRELFDIEFNGFAGDIVSGGAVLTSDALLNTGNRELIARRMGCAPDLLAGFDKYVDLRKPDFYFLQNKARRDVYNGGAMSRTHIEYRVPQLDNRLVEFLYSLPDHLRRDHLLLARMLRSTFPKYVRYVPYQKTGVPLGWPEYAKEAVRNIRRVRGRLGREMRRLGASSAYSIDYTDYPTWIRQEPARSFCSALLSDPSALYREFFDREKVTGVLERHLRGENLINELSRYLTLEIWLRQVFEARFRTEDGIEGEAATLPRKG